ncbi:MAG: gliding motility-associated C-terminal domain-containing protein, partial [Bacteroidia bacterium]|nr:gliding motility-associated C-terminal domain-containing protein [Bacteroidia bacterium]
DGIVARFNKGNGAMVQAAYIGTSNYDQAYFSQTDNSGNPYFYGQTEGTFPILSAPFNQPGKGQFIVRMDSLLATTTMSTTFGATDNRPNISPSAFLVDQCERIFVSGWGGEVNDHLIDQFTFEPKKHRNTGSTFNMPITPDAAQSKTDGSDFYVAIFSKNMYSLAYATYFGGVSSGIKQANEHVDGGTSRFDKKGIIYQSVCAGCGRNGLFPTTPNAYSRTNNSTNCNNALFKIDFENLNKVPRMKDTFIEVTATESMSFGLTATDPDPYDPVSMSYTWIRRAGARGINLPSIVVNPGVGKASFSLNWKTDCSNWSKDTIEIRFMVFDKGCPKADTSYATVKILVKEPPHIYPSESVCVSFDRTTGRLKVAWPATTQPDMRFFKYFILRRIYNNVTVALDTVRNVAAGEYLDLNVVDPNTNNYCYYLEGYNTCDVKESAKPFCTVTELNNPIAGVDVQFATVENDRRVKISWERSLEQDFKDYELYRYPRGGAPGKLPLAFTTDTFFVDSSFNVDLESNCYRIVVTDKCGHVSEMSNPGCNVVINGSAVGRPEYYFDLNWQDYIGWKEGVSNWTLERQYNNYPWSVMNTTNASVLLARDNQLDFDWGGYWYRVTASEYLKNCNRLPATSQSNWIYLYQPPELWVPNAYTPEGNNINDVWGTVPVFVRNYSMKVYNRWGQKVWESTDKKRQWDGYVDGVKAADGVFAWHVVFDGWDDKTYKMTGTVTILH